MSDQNKNQRIPISEITQSIRFQPQYVLIIVTERNGDREQVVHCDLREFGEALAIYDGVNQYFRGEL